MSNENEEVKDLQKRQKAIEELRGFVGITPDRVVFATPEAFKIAYPNDRGKWPVFKIKPMDGLDFNAEIDDEALYRWDKELRRYLVISGAFRMARIRRCVLDWRNYMGPDGKEVPCQKGEDGKITEAAVRSLSGPTQLWLMEQIDAAASVTPEESDGLKF